MAGQPQVGQRPSSLSRLHDYTQAHLT